MHHPKVTQCRRTPSIRSGFTLIEMSIVLVIIGLIIGGILIGRDMIEQATLRSQISQIEQFQLATKTFKLKYNCLPGDCQQAASFGMQPRAGTIGSGNGDGVLQWAAGSGNNFNFWGEYMLFWRDLSDAQLISNIFNTAVDGANSAVPLTAIGLYVPPAKIGNGSYVFTVSGGWGSWGGNTGGDRLNYFGIAKLQGTNACMVVSGGAVRTYNLPGMTALQAYSIDTKIDDGLPQFGHTIAHYGTKNGWSAGAPTIGGATCGYDFPHAGASDSSTSGGPVISTTSPAQSTAATANTCYDNGNVSNATEQYSVGTASSNLNCTLLIQFQ